MDVGNNELPWSAAKTSAFLVWTACCSFVTVGVATYLTWGDGVAVQVLVAAVALAVGVGAAFGIPSLAARTGTSSTLDRSPVDTGIARERQAKQRNAEEQLTEQLALGNRLRAQLHQASSESAPIVQLIPEIDGWIDKTRAILDDNAPQFAHYFATDTHDTAEPNWPSKLQDAINLSHSSRLDRHLERLKEILFRRL
jgi:hypothetical protein